MTDRHQNWRGQLGAVLSAIGVLAGLAATGCAGAPLPVQGQLIFEQGRNVVRLEPDPGPGTNTHPITLTAGDLGAILRGVRVWERRNWFHRIFVGEAPKTRAFRDEEIALLAPPLAKALAQARPNERVSFHLSQATVEGEEETTSGWLFIREPILHLVLSEVHDRHGPAPDISKYDRQMPDVPAVSPAFHVTFEPEEYLVRVVSSSRWLAPVQREELQIDFRQALSALPAFPIKELRPTEPAPP